jgi:hypothetical protein
MGDSIMCFRYQRKLKELFNRVKFAATAPLATLFQQNALDGVEVTIRIRQAIDETGFTHYINALSLPAAFKTTPETVPSTPYLKAPEEKSNFRNCDLPGEARLKVGLVWSGGKLSYAPARDMPFDCLRPLLSRTDINWISLQKDEAPPADSPLSNWMGEVTNFADTAALIANLDLVIAVDTAVAHLAGALGKPVWLLNRFESEWRWMRGKETTPWYPSMRIFSQPEPGGWGRVIAAVDDALTMCYPPPKKVRENSMKTFLHIGCGPKRKNQTTRGFNSADWHELRLDIDEGVNPDITGTMTDMSAVADASVDAIFSSHNIEHL